MVNKTTNHNFLHNGAILPPLHNLSKCYASAAEAKIGALFENEKSDVPLHHALEEMGHPQQANHPQTENSTASSIANKTIQKKLSKSTDMNFYWL